jgi:hypothetical protein
MLIIKRYNRILYLSSLIIVIIISINFLNSASINFYLIKNIYENNILIKKKYTARIE